MKAEDVRVGMVVYDRQMDRYFKIYKHHLAILSDSLKYLRPLTKRERGGRHD